VRRMATCLSLVVDMTAVASRSVLLLGAIATISCYKDNPNYCVDGIDEDCDPPSEGFPCKTKSDCSEQRDMLACSEASLSTGFGVCVQCTLEDATACLGTSPVCGIDNLCRACSKHSDCSSAVCLGDGSCGSEATIAYVAPNGMGTACSKATPCGTMAAAVTTGKAIIKVATGLVKSSQATIIDGKAVTIFAEEGAKLDRDGDGAVLEVRSAGADVKIFDLEITGATGSSGANGIDVNPNGGSPKLALTRVKLTGNQGLGLSAQGGAVTVSQSTISGNTAGGLSIAGGSLTLSQSTISGNIGGGISISGVSTSFTVADNFITYNGQALGAQASAVGGVAITSNTAGSKFERNTIAFNQSSGSTFRGGASCNALLVGASGNLLFRNSEPDGSGGLKNDATTQANLTGGCSFGNSFSAATDAANLGFKSPLIAPFDFHLTAASPTSVRDAGGACSGTDIDGDARPQGGACDLGADEYKAN
jgi:Right handed beta helix region